MRFLRRVAVVEFAERPHSVLAEIFVERLDKPFGLSGEGGTVELEAGLHIVLEQEGAGAALVVGKVALDLRTLVDALVLLVPRGEGSYAPAGFEFARDHPEDGGLEHFVERGIIHPQRDELVGADVQILGAAYYGVPQMRWRTIIMGLRGKRLPASAFPEPSYHAPIRPNFATIFDGNLLVKLPDDGKAGLHFTTVEEAIGDLPPLKAGERGSRLKSYAKEASCDYQRRSRVGSPGVYNHEAPRLSKENKERLKYIKPGGNWTDIPDSLLPKGMQRARKSDHTKRYGRVTRDGLASTILTKCDPHWGAFFHYDQDRSFTVREAARIQSFPDHYIFTGSMVEQFAQVGNAVPPMLAEAVGLALRSILMEGE